jgi:O-antigen/teichoic acid export membrane protein
MMIGYFLGAGPVGVYAIALMFASPIHVFANSLSSAKFKDFSRLDHIPAKIFRYNFIALVAISIVALALVYLVMNFFIKNESYHDQLPLQLWLIAIVFIKGMNQPLNNWIVARGHGKILNLRSIITPFAHQVLLQPVFQFKHSSFMLLHELPAVIGIKGSGRSFAGIYLFQEVSERLSKR